MWPEPGQAERRPVLVVEDSADDFDTVVVAAQRARVANRLVHAADADAAARLFGQEPAGSFAFVLLDYNLPGVDGLVFLRRMREGLQARLPAVILTTSVNPCDRDAFYKAGANAYHLKQVQYSECLRTLEAIFNYWLHRVALPGHAPLPALAEPTR